MFGLISKNRIKLPRLGARTLVGALGILSWFVADAQFDQDGYYRVENFKTTRYVYVRDNKGWLNTATSDAELGAIELWKGHENTISDPGSIIYIKTVGSQWDFEAQGTGVYKIIETYVNYRKNSDNSYYLYGSKSGMTQYLGDSRANTSSDQGVMSSSATGDYRKWNIHPVKADGNNYFGIKPTVSANGKYYQPFYAAFPFSTYSTGMKVYCIKTVGYGMAVLSEITGIVPASTPVLIECSKSTATDNRLQLGGSASAVSGNMLGGTYFMNTSSKHNNLTPYNKSTMRVLGKMADGSLGFITADIANIPANQSYLKVPDGTPAQLKVVTQAEYDRYLATRPNGITLNTKSTELNIGETFNLIPTVSPADATDYTITWSSSSQSVASVNNSGQVKALKPGETTITARINDQISATCKITVKQPVVTLKDESIELIEGDSYSLIATITPAAAADYTITWTSSSPEVASVTGIGQVKALTVGQTTITARISEQSFATCKVTVNPLVIPVESISLSAPSVTLVEKTSATLTAHPFPATATDYDPKWSTSDDKVATVDDGVIYAVAPGEAVITVTSGKITAECSVTVMPEPEILPEDVSLNLEETVLKKGDTLKLIATVTPDDADHKEVNWQSSNPSVVSVDTDGLATALHGGAATITATTVNGLSASCDITVNVPVESIELDRTHVSAPVETEFFLIATILPEDATNQEVEWETSDPLIATVNQEGLVYVTGIGAATITVRTLDGTDLHSSCSLNAMSGIDGIVLENATVDVYSTQGILIRKDADAQFLKGLQPGIYIIADGTVRTKTYIGK